MIPITSLLDEPISKTPKDWSTGLEQRDMKQDLSWFCLVSHFPDTLLGSDIVSLIKEKEISINYMVIDKRDNVKCNQVLTISHNIQK